MKYVYALASEVESSDVLPPGLGGAPVYRIDFGKISALISDMASDPLVGTPQNALTHQGVVQAALEGAASILPCRFGTRLQSEGEILSLLEHHYALLETKLALLAGKMEVGVHAIFSEYPEDTAQPLKAERLAQGATYLLGKKRQSEAAQRLSKKAEELGQELNKATTPLWTDRKMQTRRIHQGLLLSLCYLVAREDLGLFKAAYRHFERTWPGLKLAYTGPWPPYSFSDIDLHSVQEIGRR